MHVCYKNNTSNPILLSIIRRHVVGKKAKTKNVFHFWLYFGTSIILPNALLHVFKQRPCSHWIF